MSTSVRWVVTISLVGLALFLTYTVTSTMREIQELSEPGAPHKDIQVILALTTHLHNKAVHIPIGCVIVAFGLLCASTWKPQLETPARWCMLVGFAASIAALATGLGQIGVYEGGGKEWIAVMHRGSGYATVAALGVWSFLAWLRPGRVLLILFGFGILLLIGLTGFLGGIVAHG